LSNILGKPNNLLMNGVKTNTCIPVQWLYIMRQTRF
jgi:hypothetical protein